LKTRPKIWKMRLVRTALFCGFGVSASTAALSEPIPAEITGKSIELSWTEHNSLKDDDGGMRYVDVIRRAKLYLGTQGRIFSTVTSEGLGSTLGAHHFKRSKEKGNEVHESEVAGAGGEKMNWRVQGGGLASVQLFKEGARQVVITFGGDHKSCAVDVRYGKSAGQTAIKQKQAHSLSENELVNSQIASSNCSVRDGNVFAQ